MIIFEILIYVFFAWAMCSLAKKSFVSCPNTTSQNNRYIWWYILFFTTISAIRWYVGTDSVSYAMAFCRGNSNFEATSQSKQSELIMWMLVEVVHNCKLHFSVGLGILAYIQIFFIVRAYREHTFILTVLPIVLFGSHFYWDLMDGVRQEIVACVFLWASSFITDGKWKSFLVAILISSLMHHSAYILLPFYFFRYIRFDFANKRIVSLIIFLVCFAVGETPQFSGLFVYAESLASLMNYNNYVEDLTILLVNGETADKAFGPMQMSYFILAILSIWYGPALKNYYSDKIRNFNLWYNFSYFYVCAYFLVCNVSYLLVRPVDYFGLFHMTIISLLLYMFMNESIYRNGMKQILIFVIWINASWYIHKGVVKESEGIIEVATYKTFFMHADQVKYVEKIFAN